jgi:hypothetical protein
MDGSIGRAGLAGKSAEPALVISTALLLVLAISSTAKPTAELTRSVTASTPSRSNQRRAIAAPMSGLFW